MTDSAVKEKALRQATDFIQAHFEGQWLGVRANEFQKLAWPRQRVRDIDGFHIDDNVIPFRVKDATAELAVRALAGTLVPDQTTPGTIRGTKVKVGPIEKEVQYSGGSQQTLFLFVEKILATLLVPPGRLRRQ